jgi:hypothetical protein
MAPIPIPMAAPVMAPFGRPIQAPIQAPIQEPMPQAMAPQPVHDPYVSMKPPSGKQFDLRAADDGMPTENVRSRGSRMVILFAAVVALVGGGVGWGFGVAAVGRLNFNTANAAGS